MKYPINLLILDHYPIYEQLQLEEAILRTDSSNWCIINTGSIPAIVLGISGKPEQLIDQKRYQQNPVPLIQRFSGGGTVFVDANTYFVTFIGNRNIIDGPCFPERLLKWTEAFYQPVIQHEHFQLTENDYTISDRKFGGNAQYLRKDRWLHHSTLLWDYHPDHMEYLLMPQKVPQYRSGRSHDDFLTTLNQHISHKGELTERILNRLKDKFEIQHAELDAAKKYQAKPHRKSTKLLVGTHY